MTLRGAASSTTKASNSSSYTFTGLTNGTYVVTPTNSGYTFSPASQQVIVNSVNGVGVNFSVTIEQAHSVVLSWNASASTVVGYNVYRSTVSDSGFTKLNSSLVTTLTLHGHDRAECNDLFLCSHGGELQGQ